MADFQSRKRTRRILYSPLSIVLLFLLLLLLGRGVWNIYEKEKLARGEAEAAKRELQSAEARRGILVSEIERLSSSRGVEEELRRKFGAAKPGEEVIVIVDNKNVESPATSSSWWQKFLKLF